MEILEAPYFDGYVTYPREFVNWLTGMEQSLSKQTLQITKRLGMPSCN